MDTKKMSKEIFLVMVSFLLFGGCMSLLREADWQRFERVAAEQGWTPAQKEALRQELRERDQDLRAAVAKETADVAHVVLDALPGPAPKKPLKDLADWGIYALLGLGGAEVMRRKMKNSAPGKLFGPVKSGKK